MKNLKTLITLGFFASVALLNAQKTLLTEDFSKCAHATCDFTNAGTLAASATEVTNFDGITNTTGWSGAKVYPAAGYAKFGTSKAAGNIVTPAIDLTKAFEISFKAWAWAGATSEVDIQLDGVSLEKVSVVETKWDTYKVSSATLGTATSKITFSFSKRAFIDDLVISEAIITNINDTKNYSFDTFTKSGSLTISNLRENDRVEVYTLLGQKVKSEVYANADIQFSLPNGIYVVSVISNEKVQSKKVLID